MGDLRTESGRDPTKAIIETVEEQGKQMARDAVHIWFEESHDRLIEAAEQRAGTSDRPDDSEGKTYRRENNLTDMLDEFQPPEWVESENAWVWAVTHAAAVFHEFGADAHEIRAKAARALAFEWPDAPQEIEEQFEETFPTVFFNSVQHPGTPAIGMVRYGREKAVQRLKSAGVSVQEFGRAYDDI